MLSGFMLISCFGSRLLRLRSHRLMTIPLIAILFITSMLPRNSLQTFQFVKWIGVWGLFLTIAYPLFLLIVSVIRKKGGFT
ncbi:hypothetical protein [Marinicrinis lubricantis]|uniref:Spore germination protein n=1 Tax=Marinicrinis lubricantis TaxID=2086470 RepID=A0ABW1IN52_9BACL